MTQLIPQDTALPRSSPVGNRSGDNAQQLGLEDELALLVLLAGLVRLVVFPPDGARAAAALDVAHDVAAGCHVTLGGLGGLDVDDAVEEVCLAMLASEVLRVGGKGEGLC